MKEHIAGTRHSIVGGLKLIDPPYRALFSTSSRYRKCWSCEASSSRAAASVRLYRILSLVTLPSSSGFSMTLYV